MAESTRDIKRRIRGITNIKQITNAMELVASAKLKRAREKLERTRPYYNTVLESIQEILTSTGNINHPFLEVRDVKKSLYIVLTGDRGLAGGYNSNVLRLVEEAAKERKDAVKIIAVGSKAGEFFRRRNYDIEKEITGISEAPVFSDAVNITRIALELFRKEEVDEIIIAYTKFHSPIQQEAKLLKLLPSDETEVKSEEKTNIIEYEPSPEEVLDYLIPKYIESTIYGALIESSSSEQGARRTAMGSATDNAEEMIDELQLSYNRARQAAITVEISEIVAGAEALK